MPSVPIKYVVSFSSQDEKHPVNNMLHEDVFKKWLCNPQDRTGVMEAIFQLEHPCNISYINLGSIWCASIEVKVGRSDWPAGREFETLIYTVSLMTPADSTLGRNHTKTEMFTTDAFCSEVAMNKWDRIKVTCRQPYKKTSQFGLSFLHVKTTAPVQSSNTVTQIGKESPGLSLDSSTVSSIKQHFLGKIKNGVSKSDQDLKSKLLKIAASSDSVGEVEGALSRTAKLVMAASKGVSKPATHLSKTPDSLKRGMYSNHLDQKYGPQFEEEVKLFLSKLSVNTSELDNITLADVRHRFERKIRRKLTKEEKKTFAELTTDSLSAIFNDSNDHCDKNGKKSNNENFTNGTGNNKVPSSVVVSANDTMNMPTPNQNTFRSVETKKPLTPNQKGSLINVQPSYTSTPNQKTPSMNADTRKSTSLNSSGNAERKVTAVGKRKLNACDDVVTPPSKKMITEKGVPFKQKMKQTENSPTALKARTFVNEILKRRSIQNENSFKDTSLSDRNKLNGVELEKTIGRRNPDLKSPENQVTNIMDTSTTGVQKKTPLKDSSFGEFLLNVTLTQSDVEDDDDEILFPKQKVSKRGKGRGRGRRKQKSQNDPGSPLVNSSTPAGRGRGSQQRGRGSRQRGRGRGKQARTPHSADINSVEVRPTGFAKCDGCGDYFGAELLSIHQDKCTSWKNKINSSESSDSPWLCTRPESPSSSSQDGSGVKGQRSPPWVMAALAAERRLNKYKEGGQLVEDREDNFSSDDYVSNSSSFSERSSQVLEEQRKALGQFSPGHCGSSKSNSSFDNQSYNRKQLKCNQSNHLSQSVSKNISSNQSVSKHVSNNQSASSNTSNNQSESSNGGCFDLTMLSDSDSDSRDSLMGNTVECPLCGVILPSSVIEVHAAHCGL